MSKRQIIPLRKPKTPALCKAKKEKPKKIKETLCNSCKNKQ
jgi:hypothetical protein